MRHAIFFRAFRGSVAYKQNTWTSAILAWRIERSESEIGQNGNRGALHRRHHDRHGLPHRFRQGREEPRCQQRENEGWTLAQDLIRHRSCASARDPGTLVSASLTWASPCRSSSRHAFISSCTEVASVIDESVGNQSGAASTVQSSLSYRRQLKDKGTVTDGAASSGKEARTITRDGNGYGVTHITLHIMVGYLAGTDSTFANSASQASAHYGIGSDRRNPPIRFGTRRQLLRRELRVELFGHQHRTRGRHVRRRGLHTGVYRRKRQTVR